MSSQRNSACGMQLIGGFNTWSALEAVGVHIS